MTKILRLPIVTFLLVATSGAGAVPVVGHIIDVRLNPQAGSLQASDQLVLPGGRSLWSFSLHSGLHPQIVSGSGRLQRLGSDGELERFRLEVAELGPVTLRYGGRIQHTLEAIQESLGRARQWSPGTITDQGIVLDAESGWYPQIEDALQRFDLSIRVPAGWLAVSQGEGPATVGEADGTRVRWREDHPQQEIYLVAAPFTLYRQATPHAEAEVFLRTPDEALAKRYLNATGKYLALYSNLIGTYPYAKFALVENFWETGYGMPSFTLLGPQVIRLPFIVHTSYPHEILHNWWGNGVYVDYGSGNWSEGLTAYLADHLLKAEQGEGADCRRDALKAFADYVRQGRDFPLVAFRSRHSSASQAIGYGNALMVFHMLRRKLGDRTFVLGLRRFYRDNRFRVASYDDLRRAFEQESGTDLTDYFRQWTQRPGAPRLALSDVTQEKEAKGYRLRGRLAQTQAAPPFPLEVPVVVHLAGGETLEQQIPLQSRAAKIDLRLPATAVRVDADPRFDLFRRLVPGESPATLSGLFGNERGLIVLPHQAPAALAQAYRSLAAAWTENSPGWRVVNDSDLEALPTDLPVWLLGWSNRYLSELAHGQRGFVLDPAGAAVTLAGEHVSRAGHSVALARGRGRGEQQAIGWLASGDPRALPGLARKLPHYGKYSYLVFAGPEPANERKGQWQTTDSDLMVWLTKDHSDLREPVEPPLTAVMDQLSRPIGAD